MLDQSQNFNENFFVFGKIGQAEIIRQNLGTFNESLIEEAWTNIIAYRPAQKVNIQLLFNANKNFQDKVQLGSNVSLEKYYVEENRRLFDFKNFASEIESKKNNNIDTINREKTEFLNGLLKDSTLNAGTPKSEIIKKIKDNIGTICLTNSNLSSKMSKYSTYLSTLNPKPQQYTPSYNNDFSLFSNPTTNSYDSGKSNQNTNTINNNYSQNNPGYGWNSSNTNSYGPASVPVSYGASNTTNVTNTSNTTSNSNQGGYEERIPANNIYGYIIKKTDAPNQSSNPANTNSYGNFVNNYGHSGYGMNNSNSPSSSQGINNQNPSPNYQNQNIYGYGYGYNQGGQGGNNNKKTYYD